MAKKPNKAKLAISAPSQPMLATSARNEEAQYKLREDADRIKRYAELRKDKARHSAAMDHIRSEHEGVMGLDESGEGEPMRRGVARAGRRTSSRRLGGRR
jgi:hypothetical protein